MTTQEIIEGNKLIAEFMGWTDSLKYGSEYVENKSKYRKVPYWSDCNMIDMRSKLSFHQSWDWLMPVVEKIESVHFEKTEREVWVDVLIQDETCYIIEESNYFSPFKKIGTTKLEATWLACVEFIKWYNQNK